MCTTLKGNLQQEDYQNISYCSTCSSEFGRWSRCQASSSTIKTKTVIIDQSTFTITIKIEMTHHGISSAHPNVDGKGCILPPDDDDDDGDDSGADGDAER